MSHCADPARCSVCLGVVPKRVQIQRGVTTVDGEVTDHGAESGNMMPKTSGRGRFRRNT